MAYNKAPSMPPPGGKGLTVAIGIGKPKGKGMPDEEQDPNEQEPDNDEDDPEGGKMSPERAIVIREDQHCRNCSNYEPMDGSCKEVEGTFSPDDACFSCFEPMSDEGNDSGEGMMPPPGAKEEAMAQ